MWRQSVVAASVATLLVTGTLRAVPTDPVFDVEASLLSVTYDPVSLGYVWTYQVCATPESNRGLSHWTMSICGDPTVPVWDLELPEVDYFDLAFFSASGGEYFYTSASGNLYHVEFGTDPTTGLYGIKFNWESGYEIKGGTCGTLAFRLDTSFNAIERTWSAKGATLVDYGLALGPACAPDVPPPTPPEALPEPGTMVLLGAGAVGALVARRYRSARGAHTGRR